MATSAPAVPRPALRRRLVWAFVLVAGVCAGALAAGSYALVYQARLADSLDAAVSDGRYQLVLAGQFVPVQGTRRAELLRSFESTGRHVLVADGGSVVASSPAYRPRLPGALRDAAADGALAYHRVSEGDRRLLLVGGRIPGATTELYVVTDETRRYAELRQLGLVLLAGWLAVVVVASLTGRLVARRTLEPVAAASQAARAVAEGLLDTRLPAGGGDEFGAWADSFNRMADALGAKIAALLRAEARERRFTADVAHELRTPVAALVAEAGLLRESLGALPDDARRPAELLVRDVVRLRRLVDELMELSRLDAGSEPVRPELVELPELLAAVLGTRGLTDQVSLTASPVTLTTDPRRFERVVGNLVDNAVTHGGEGVAVTGHRTGDEVVVTVADQGPGIPAEYLPRLFDRFSKMDGARTAAGSGLGMAIAWQNADLLGGRIEVSSERGRGTRCRFTLPVTPLLRDGEATAGYADDGDK